MTSVRSAALATAPPAATAAESTRPIWTATQPTRVGPTCMRATASEVTSQVHHSSVNVRVIQMALSAV